MLREERHARRRGDRRAARDGARGARPPYYLSQVERLAPAAGGITVEVLNRDDRLLLHNTGGRDVVVAGYAGEPYARVLADGTVAVNTDSPAYYLNDDRLAQVKVPAAADGKGAPRWKEISRTGRFEWHDHRRTG